MSANNRQVGGDHYKGTYQHWDFVVETQMHYLLGCATKYVTRHRKKNGKEDLEKAKHYIEKYCQVASSKSHLYKFFPFLQLMGEKQFSTTRPDRSASFSRLVEYFCYSNELHEDDAELFKFICNQPMEILANNFTAKIDNLIEKVYA